MRFVGLCLCVATATAALSQVPAAPPHVVHVTGTGKVSTMPDVALIDYWVAGQGKTPDDASKALAARKQAIDGGVKALLRAGVKITDSNLVVIAVRGAECQANNYNQQPRLDEGPCAVIGYLATMQGTIRTSEVGKAGTAVGLASRLGARDARLQSFRLGDSQAAYAAAVDAAFADAKRQAERLAKAAGEKLGPVLTIGDQTNRFDQPIGVEDIGRFMAPAPPPPAAPVAIDVNSRSIETVAQVYVTFALDPS